MNSLQLQASPEDAIVPVGHSETICSSRHVLLTTSCTLWTALFTLLVHLYQLGSTA